MLGLSLGLLFIYLCTLFWISLCVCVFSSHPFWTSSSLDVPDGVTQEEGHVDTEIRFFALKSTKEKVPSWKEVRTVFNVKSSATTAFDPT